jgi:hypothetical protein
MVPPRSPDALRFSSMLPFSHSVIRPTTGSEVSPNSVDDAFSMPASERAASMQAICMPKQMPKYGTLRSRANLAARILPSAALAETARHQDAMHLFQPGRGVFLLEDLRFDPFEADPHAVGDAAMGKRLHQRLVGVLEARVFADDGDRHLALGIVDAVGDLLPALHARLRRRIDAEGGQHFRIEAFLVIGIGTS